MFTPVRSVDEYVGLGVTPWSPLKSGVLSGKYTRENAGKMKPDRGAWDGAQRVDTWKWA